MSADAKALTKRFYDEVMTQGKLEVIDELIDDSFVEHQIFPGVPPNKEGVRQSMQAFRNAFPDLKIEIMGMVAEGDEVWVHAMVTGTQTGELMGIPPTGKSVSFTMIDRVRISDGKAVEHWGASDDLGMMTQLGVIPEMG